MIYISTGGFKSEKCINIIKKLVQKGIFDIELSGGKYEVNQIKTSAEKYLGENSKVTKAVITVPAYFNYS